MGKWGKCEFGQMKMLEKRLGRLAETEARRFYEAAARELAARLLAKVIKRTPVGKYEKEVAMDSDGNKIRLTTGKNKGKYKKSTVKKGGTLRRGWTSNTEEEAERANGTAGAAAYANSLGITHRAGIYEITITNPVHYAPYVEYGHRTPGGKGWVDGRYMLTISENELQAMAPAILEKRLQAFLKGAL